MENLRLKRAKTFDEPFVRMKLCDLGFLTSAATTYEDWNHIDIKVLYNGNTFSVDVKRNTKENKNSHNFSFTLVNGRQKYFPFKSDSYFAFIDDLNYKIYLVIQTDFERLVTSSECIELHNTGVRKVKLVPSFKIANIAKKIIDCSSEYDKLYLENT